MGARCSYAHGDHELRFTPEFYKTSVCSAFQKGQCTLGEKCRYAHGDADLRTSSIYDKPTVGGGFSNSFGMVPTGEFPGNDASLGVAFPTVSTIDENKTK